MCVSKREYIYIYIFSDTFIIIDPSQSYQGIWPGQRPTRLHTVTAAQGISAIQVPKKSPLASLLRDIYLVWLWSSSAAWKPR